MKLRSLSIAFGLAGGVIVTLVSRAADPVARIEGFKGAVVALTWSPDGLQIAAADESSKAAILDVATAKIRHRLDGYETSGSRLAWSPDGRRVYRLGNNEWTVSATDGKSPQTVRCGFHGCRQLALSPDGRYLAVAGAGTVGLWNAADGKLLGTAEPHPNWRIQHLAFAPKGHQLATACDDRKPQLLGVPGLEPISGGLPAFESKPVSLTFDPARGDVLLFDREDRLFRVSGGVIQPDPVRIPGPEVLSMDASMDGRYVVFAGGSEVKILEPATRAFRRLRLTNTALGARSVAFSPKGDVIAVGDHDSAVRIFRVADLEVAR